MTTYSLNSVNKDVLVLGASLGLYTIEEAGKNSYKDTGVTVELPPQLKSATLPGLHLRVGQRFGAFSHSAFVNLMPGQGAGDVWHSGGFGIEYFGQEADRK